MDDLSMTVAHPKTVSGQRLIVASSPHTHTTENVSHIMMQVVLALLPAALYGILLFGLPAFVTLALSVFSAIAGEAAAQRLSRQTLRVKDNSAALTGLLLGMSLPPHVPWYVPVIGSLVAVVISKHLMGGLGSNVFNPAHIGRAFLMASYPAVMTTFSGPSPFSLPFLHQPDCITAATPLAMARHQGFSVLSTHAGSPWDLYTMMATGNHAGCIGETSTILLVLGGVYLAVRGYIRWQTPVVMIGTVGVGAWLFGGDGLFHGDPWFHMMAGGLILGAFFMATDPVTVPITPTGQIIFAAGAGLITIIIRFVGGYPEGVCYAILLMNAVTPMIDKFIVPRKFGG